MLSKPDQLCIATIENECPAWISKKRPLVLDPINPYYNLASRLHDQTTIRVLTLSTLDILRKAGSSASQILIPDLFIPQLGNDIPAMFKWCSFQLRFVLEGSWIKTLQVRRIEDLGGQSMNPSVEWRSQNRLDPRACPEDAQRRTLDMFNAFVNVSTTAILHHVSQKQQKGTGEVVAAAAFVDNMLREVIGTAIPSWTPTIEAHESRDVTCTFGQIPIASRKDDLQHISLKLSAKLDDQRLYRGAYDISGAVFRLIFEGAVPEKSSGTRR